MSSHLREFGLIRSTIWQSERFCSLERLEAQLAYFWLHTGQKTCAGVLRLGPAHMADELNFLSDVPAATRVLDELEGVGLIVRVKPFVVITQFLKATPVKSYRHAIAAFRECFSLPDCEVKRVLFKELQHQKGAIDLTVWRNKQNEPHAVLFDIHAYAEQLVDQVPEPLLNPLHTPSTPIGEGSGKPIPKHINEKGEGIPICAAEPAPLQKAVVPLVSDGFAEKTKFLGPYQETIEAAKRMGSD